MGDLRDPRHNFIVPAIKAFDRYDFNKAKTRASLTWLVVKAFGTDSVPEELGEPFYKDQYEQEHLKPPVVGLLLSAELYCRAGSLILKSDAAKPLLGHDAVIQALAQKGLYVTDQERLVTERDLQKKPIQMTLLSKAACKYYAEDYYPCRYQWGRDVFLKDTSVIVCWHWDSNPQHSVQLSNNKTDD